MSASNESRTSQEQGKIQVQSQISVTVIRRQKTMKSIENQLTIMLLLVTMLFLILMIPTYLRFIYTNLAPGDTPANCASLILFFHISSKLYVTNSGINFFLYCISGQKFPNDLKEILGCRKGSDFKNSGQETSCSVAETSGL